MIAWQGDNVFVLRFARFYRETFILTTRATVAALFFISSVCFAQTAPKTTMPAKQKPATPAPAAGVAPETAAKPAAPTAASTVPENAIVITIPGVCPPGTPAENCTTTVTRADFEKLVNAMNPNMPADAHRSVAAGYAQLLAVYDQALKMGVDKDPKLQIQLRVREMSMLAQMLPEKVAEDSKPTQAEVQSYYAENSAKYEEFKLRRIVVLKSASSGLKPEELKAFADKIRERAAAGEDPDKLEVEAYKETKSAAAPPNTDLGWKRKGAMDPRHEPQILPLKSGEVSPVMEDGQAYYIYKVESKRQQPLESVQKDIETTLQRERAQKTMKGLIENIKPQLNEAYFGPEPQKTPPTGQQTPPKQ